MKNDDITKKLDSLSVPDITLESHFRSLNALLLDEYESCQAKNPRAGLSVNNLLSVWRRARISRKVAVVAVPVIVLLAFLLLGFNGTFTGTSSVIARAYAAIEKLESYKSVEDIYWQMDETGDTVLNFRDEFEYADPDRYHMVTDLGEIIVTGDLIYTRQFYVTPKTIENLAGMAPAIKEEMLETLDSFAEIHALPDEEIDGTDCYHYRGTVDIDRWLDSKRPLFIQAYNHLTEKYPWFERALDEYVNGLEDLFRTQEITYEFWFGKDDYLMRQSGFTMRTLPDTEILGLPFKCESTTNYYDFNKPVTIEAPLDESGELLEGWTVSVIE